MANEDTARIWEDFLKVAKHGTKNGGIRAYKIDLCKNAIKLSNKLLEHGPISGDRYDIWVEYLGKVYEVLEGDKETIEKTVREYFLALHSGGVWNFSIKFSDKTEGMSIGLVCDVKYSDLDHRYFIKCHQHGSRPTSSSISSLYNSISLPYVQELYVYKLLSLIQICSEVHFIFPQTSATMKSLYIGTREIKFTPAKQLTFQEANPRALMLVHFLQFILRLEDIGTNSGSYGQNDEGEPVIIDFWVTSKEDYTLSDNQIEDFWKNQHGSNSKLISEVMTRVPREERRNIIHEAMETWSLIRKIEEAKSAVEEFLLKIGERLEISGDISRYVRDIKTNVINMSASRSNVPNSCSVFDKRSPKSKKESHKSDYKSKEQDRTESLVLYMTISFCCIELPNGISHGILWLITSQELTLTYGIRLIDYEDYVSVVCFLLNIFHLIVLTRKPMRSSGINWMFTAIALSDICSLLMTMRYFLLKWVVKSIKCVNNNSYYPQLIISFGEKVLLFARRCSTWLTVLMGVIRTLVIRNPMSTSFSKLAEPKAVFYLVAATVLCSFSFFFVGLFELELYAGNDRKCGNRTVTVYYTVISHLFAANNLLLERAYTVLVSIFSNVLPAVMFPIVVAFLIKEIRKANKNRTNLITRSKEQDRTESLVLYMTISFCCVELPNGISRGILWFIRSQELTLNLFQWIVWICPFFLTLNTASHPVLCLLMSSQYRKNAKTIISCGTLDRTKHASESRVLSVTSKL